MGDSAGKAIMFGVGMMITLIIASSIISMFGQMKNIYKDVGTTNTDIMKGFGELPMYQNTIVTGLDVINCANKYYDKNLIIVSYDGVELNTDAGLEFVNSQYESGAIKYEDKFRSTVDTIEINGVDKNMITFTKI